jgi:hypothetical protein
MRKKSHEDCEIMHVSMWENGQVVCFCIHTVVIRQYSGQAEEAIPKLRQAYKGVIQKASFIDVPEGKQLKYEPMLD